MSKQFFIANPQHTESDWKLIANTISMSMEMPNMLEVKYYENSDVHTVVGKVDDIDNMDNKLTMRDGNDRHVLPYEKIIFATIVGGKG